MPLRFGERVRCIANLASETNRCGVTCVILCKVNISVLMTFIALKLMTPYTGSVRVGTKLNFKLTYAKIKMFIETFMAF